MSIDVHTWPSPSSVVTLTSTVVAFHPCLCILIYDCKGFVLDTCAQGPRKTSQSQTSLLTISLRAPQDEALNNITTRKFFFFREVVRLSLYRDMESRTVLLNPSSLSFLRSFAVPLGVLEKDWPVDRSLPPVPDDDAGFVSKLLFGWTLADASVVICLLFLLSSVRDTYVTSCFLYLDKWRHWNDRDTVWRLCRVEELFNLCAVY